MKRLVYILFVAIFFYSCNKLEDKPKEEEEFVELGNLQKILDGYHVRAIEFDSKGNAWIGTFEQGIIRYNAKETVFFNPESIIPGGFILWDIAIDKKDNVWFGVSGKEFEFDVGLNGGGLLKYDGQEFTLYNSQNTPMPLDMARKIEIDSQNNIWFICGNYTTGGLVKYDGTEWTIFTPDNSVLPYASINSIAIDQSDNVWLGMYNYLIKINNSGGWEKYSGEELGFYQYGPGGGYNIGDIKINSRNCVVGTIDYKYYNFDLSPLEYPVPNLLVMFVFDGKKITEFVTWTYFYVGIQNITIDHKDYIWCSQTLITPYRHGVWYGGEHGKIIDHSKFDEYIAIIREAPDYKIWFGTGNGIYIQK